MKQSNLSSIHIFKAAESLIRVRLGDCQATNPYYSNDNINVLREKIADADALTVLAETIRFTVNCPILTAKFYTVTRGKWSSVYSDYIEQDNVNQVARDFFDDLKNDVIAFSSDCSNKIQLSHFKRGEQISSISKNGFLTNINLAKQTMRLLNLPDKSLLTDLLAQPVPQAIQRLAELIGLPLTTSREDVNPEDPNVFVDEFYL